MTEINGGERHADRRAGDAVPDADDTAHNADDTAPEHVEALPEPVDGMAPVIPLFGRGAGQPRAVPGREPVRNATWQTGGADGPADRSSRDQPLRSSSSSGAGRRGSEPVDHDVDPQSVHDAAETMLLRRLRTRQLSVSESRGVIIDAGMTADAADELLARFERLGYLDDVALAEQLVHAAVDRKGQGRQAISPLLARRGVPRDIVDAVFSALPDDDLERALEFARTKARSLGARDRDTALRRLLGQLARRGYPSSVSLTAARQALDER